MLKFIAIRQFAVLFAWTIVWGDILCLAPAAQVGRQPLSKEAIVGMLKGEVSPHRLAFLARQKGIDFQVTSEVESELRRAGATAELLATLREIAPKPPVSPQPPPPSPQSAQIVIQTSPDAQVYVDDVFKGQASPQGRLVIDNAKPGDHELRVSLAGKRNYEQKVTVIAGQVTQITAVLTDLAGSVAVRTLPGADVFLDNSGRGTADANGQLAIPEVAAGTHELRVTASGKKEYRETFRVAAGRESTVDATLADIEKPEPLAPIIEIPRQKSSGSLLHPASLKLQPPPVFSAKFTTTEGDFVVQVTRAWSPRGADRFYNLVVYQFFDGAAFFRVLQGFVAQFGISPRPDVSRVWSYATILDDPVTQSNTRGMVTFATAGPNTRTTQVFINLSDNTNLDSAGFSPFGKVTSGMEVIEKLYSDYGEGKPNGNGPDQNRIQKEGKVYLERAFPLLDTIKSAVIEP